MYTSSIPRETGTRLAHFQMECNLTPTCCPFFIWVSESISYSPCAIHHFIILQSAYVRDANISAPQQITEYQFILVSTYLSPFWGGCQFRADIVGRCNWQIISLSFVARNCYDTRPQILLIFVSVMILFAWFESIYQTCVLIICRVRYVKYPFSKFS